MGGMSLAESAILLHLETIGMRLLVLHGIVVAVLALRAGKGYSRAHDASFLESFTVSLNHSLHKKKDLYCVAHKSNILFHARQTYL